jgi:hypothetical protein
MYQIVQQLKDKNKHITFGFICFCAQQATCLIQHATGKVTLFQVSIKARKNAATSPSAWRGGKYLKRGTASHYCPNLQQYSGTDSVSRARLKSDGTG